MSRTILLRPVGPYSLARSARGASCTSRRWRDGVLDMVYDTDAGPARAATRQLADGTLEAWIDAPETGAAHDRLRRLLALDLDTGPFERRAARDPLLAPVAARLRGARPLPIGSAAHALLRGVSGQLVQGSEARRVEARAVRAVAREHAGMWLPLSTAELRSLTVSELARCGLAERRARALARAARLVDLDGLDRRPTPDVVRALTSVPGIGPWTAGAVCLDGLGRVDAGMAGDLGLVKLLTGGGAAATVAETAALLDRYAPFQGLAGMYLLSVPGARSRATVAELARTRPSAVVV